MSNPLNTGNRRAIGPARQSGEVAGLAALGAAIATVAGHPEVAAAWGAIAAAVGPLLFSLLRNFRQPDA